MASGKPSEFAVKFFRRSQVSAMRLLGCVEDAQINLLLVVADLSHEFLGSLVVSHALEACCILRFDISIAHVLRLGGLSQIGPFVVQWVAVDVIDSVLREVPKHPSKR